MRKKKKKIEAIQAKGNERKCSVLWGLFSLPHPTIELILNIIAKLKKSAALADRINPVLIDSSEGSVHNMCCAPCHSFPFAGRIQ